MNIQNSYNLPSVCSVAAKKTVPKPQEQSKVALNSCPLQDIFEKSPVTPVNCAFPVINTWNEERIQKIYDRTYDIVMTQNPITTELNLAKPSLNFVCNTDKDSKTLASYTAGINEIKIKNKDFFTEDLYLCFFKDKSGEVVDVNVFGQKDKEAFLKKHTELTAADIKLTDSEKELYISGTFAHELRHCIQTHLLASTEGCMEERMTRLNKYKEAIEEFIETKKGFTAITGEPYMPSEEDEDLKKLSYGLNYKPKKIFDKNTLFKYSILPNDNRYWSLKEHFLPAGKKIADDYETYYNCPLEIDAYNYEYEFLITEILKQPKGLLRDEVTDNMLLAVYFAVADFEFPFIIKQIEN